MFYGKNGIVLAATVMLMAPALTLYAGDKDLPTGNKPGSTVNITSIHVQRQQNDASVTLVNNNGVPVPGWPPVAGGTGGRKGNVTLRGPGLTPGTSVKVRLSHNNFVPGGKILGWDYPDPRGGGGSIWVGRCPDPVSFRVVEGGPTGTDYLGYPIPPNEWGYFYEVWNPIDFEDETTFTFVDIGTESGAHDFQIIPNTFEVQSVPGFDLGDIDRLLDPDAPYLGQHYMEPEDTLGVPGVGMTWEFDALTGIASMEFLPSGRDRSSGLGAGQSGSIVGYSSPMEPMFTTEENVWSLFASGGSCPQYGTSFNFLPVPTPEPVTLILLMVGAFYLPRFRWHMA